MSFLRRGRITRLARFCQHLHLTDVKLACGDNKSRFTKLSMLPSAPGSASTCSFCPSLDTNHRKNCWYIFSLQYADFGGFGCCPDLHTLETSEICTSCNDSTTSEVGNGIWAIIWKSGQWGKSKFSNFSFKKGLNLNFKKSHIVKFHPGLIWYS